MSKLRNLVFWAALSLPLTLVISPSNAEELRQCKLIFDGMLYKGKPSMNAYGVRRAIVTDPLRWWLPNESRQEMTKGNGIEEWVRTKSPGDILVLDIEAWPTVGTKESVEATISKMSETISRIRAAGFDKQIGLYGVPPNRDYWRAQKGHGSREYSAWQAENDLLAPIMKSSDAVFPSLYTFYDDLAGWKLYALANLSEARRVSSGKPIYAFLWPQFHDSNKRLRDQHLSAEFWREELETALAASDGVVIWGGWQQQWDENAPWWSVTKLMLEKMNSACKSHPNPPSSFDAK
jgi:hypothetical protein